MMVEGECISGGGYGAAGGKGSTHNSGASGGSLYGTVDIVYTILDIINYIQSR